MRSLPGTVILVVDFSLSLLYIYPAIPFWPAEFLLKNQLLNVWGFPCILLVAFPLLLFNIVYLCLFFFSLSCMCVAMFLLGLILNGTLSASWRRRQWHPTPVLLPGKSMDGGAWWAAVHGVAGSWTRLSDFTFTFLFHVLEKEMETHSNILAWRIPGTGEPGGLPSMGSHRVGYD